MIYCVLSVKGYPAVIEMMNDKKNLSDACSSAPAVFSFTGSWQHNWQGGHIFQFINFLRLLFSLINLIKPLFFHMTSERRNGQEDAGGGKHFS